MLSGRSIVGDRGQESDRRNFSIKEKMRLQVRWETFNTTNHTNFTLGGTTFTAVGSASAGVISSAFSNRVMQVAMKLNF